MPRPRARRRRRGGGDRRAPLASPARRRLRDERENVRAALAWCASDPAAAPAGLELLAAVGQRGVGETGSESRRWLEQFLGLAPARTAARARCLLALDHFLRWEHEFPRAAAAAREAREIFEALGDADGAAEAASHEGLVAANLGDYAAAPPSSAPPWRGRASGGDWARAEQLRARPGGGRLRPGGPRRGPGARSRRAGRWRSATGSARSSPRPSCAWPPSTAWRATYPRARARLEALRRSDALIAGPGGPAGSQDLLALGLGSLARAEGRYAEARAHLHGALRRLHRRGEGALLRSAVCLAGLLEIARGAPARGVTLLGAGAGGEGLIGTVHVPDVRAEAPGFLERARQTLGAAAFAAAWAAGQAMSLEQAVAYALEEAPAPAAPASGASAPAPGGLTRREREVAALVARGLTNREIAAALLVTEHTAERHVEHILAKLGLRSRAQVAAWAVAHGVAEGADGAPPG